MPDATAPQFTPEQVAEVRRLQGLYPDRQGALLPVLHMAQDTYGYISLEIEEYVGKLFDLTPAHIHEVVTFYTMYFQKPKGRHVVAVCHNLTCHLMGAKGIVEHLKARLGVEPGETTAGPVAGMDRAERLLEEIERPLRQLRAVKDRMKRDEADAVTATVMARGIPVGKVAAELLRYETTLRRHLDRALLQLERLQRQRRGEILPPPIRVDVTGDGL